MALFMHEKKLFAAKQSWMKLDMSKQARSFFAGHVVGSLPMQRKIETFASNDRNYYSSSGENYFLTRMPCFIYFSQTRECPVNFE